MRKCSISPMQSNDQKIWQGWVSSSGKWLCIVLLEIYPLLELRTFTKKHWGFCEGKRMTVFSIVAIATFKHFNVFGGTEFSLSHSNPTQSPTSLLSLLYNTEVVDRTSMSSFSLVLSDKWSCNGWWSCLIAICGCLKKNCVHVSSPHDPRKRDPDCDP